MYTPAGSFQTGLQMCENMSAFVGEFPDIGRKNTAECCVKFTIFYYIVENNMTTNHEVQSGRLLSGGI